MLLTVQISKSHSVYVRLFLFSGKSLVTLKRFRIKEKKKKGRACTSILKKHSVCPDVQS